MLAKGAQRSSLCVARARAERAAAPARDAQGRFQRSVAVIGAGAAGLVAARELRREGHEVTVFEQGSQIGGVWVYTDAVEAEDLLGEAAERSRVHSSMYASLRTNLPRHVMAYTDFPFTFSATGSEDTRLFCGHREVLRYLQRFDAAFGISRLTRFNTRVAQAIPLSEAEQPADGPAAAGTANGAAAAEAGELLGPRWRLTLEPSGSRSDGSGAAQQQQQQQDFDALVVCNGHYSEPRVPDLPGKASFPGRLLHTHNYRQAGPFAGQTVAVMGASASGQDIAREIAAVADTVLFSARPVSFGSKQVPWEPSEQRFGPRGNMLRRAPIAALHADGSLSFADGSRSAPVQAVVFATGYKFSFPFLQASAAVSVADNRVQPLFKHCVCTRLPSLSFIGLPWQVIPFPLMELQSKWVARCLSGRSSLPPKEEMERDTEAFYRQREAAGVPVRYSHRLGEEQWAYNACLAAQIGPDQPPLPAWRAAMHKAGQANIRERPDSYRDSFPAEELVAEAEREGRELQQLMQAQQARPAAALAA